MAEIIEYKFLGAKILNSIKWMKNITHVAKKNLKRQPSLLWQFIGMTSGIFQVYPGV